MQHFRLTRPISSSISVFQETPKIRRRHWPSRSSPSAEHPSLLDINHNRCTVHPRGFRFRVDTIFQVDRTINIFLQWIDENSHRDLSPGLHCKMARIRSHDTPEIRASERNHSGQSVVSNGFLESWSNHFTRRSVSSRESDRNRQDLQQPRRLQSSSIDRRSSRQRASAHEAHPRYGRFLVELLSGS